MPQSAEHHPPWQSAFVGRFFGSIRRESTDHIIAVGEAYLLRVVRGYTEYDTRARSQQSLEGNVPTPRAVDYVGLVEPTPVQGGLHHRYSRVA